MSFNIDYNLDFHKIMFSNSLRDIVRRKWKDFDFHRLNFTSSLERIKTIKWIEIDKKKYEKIFNPESSSLLRSSRYSHLSSSVKCFPTSRTCYECFKYFCPCCGSGTNCMYGERCLDRRCSLTIESYKNKENKEIESQPIRVFVYSTSAFDMFSRSSVCSRDIYGY